VATSKKYGAATIYWDNGYNGRYGFGLFNRSTNAVTQQGVINAIMSGLS
jgi:endoglucanase